MANAGLGSGWTCEFANDFDRMKVQTYAQNWGDRHLVCRDVARIDVSELPGRADLAWASFPCQDVSLAGDGKGLGQSSSSAETRSGAFWPFWALMRALVREGRPPRQIVLENVCGVLTSRKGKDFAEICNALADAGYVFGAIVLDARLFVPQSRQRVFIVAVHKGENIPQTFMSKRPAPEWHPASLVTSYAALGQSAKNQWIWWTLPMPPIRKTILADVIEDNPASVTWHSGSQTQYLLALMSSVNLAKVEAAKALGRRIVGSVYKRTRPDSEGVRRQRAEVRFDDVAGCLRTPGGGSSRQTILVVDGSNLRSRLMSPREAARLMGLDDSYQLPTRYNDAYHVAGDGVCVPVVRHIAANLLEPILAANVGASHLIAAE